MFGSYTIALWVKLLRSWPQVHGTLACVCAGGEDASPPPDFRTGAPLDDASHGRAGSRLEGDAERRRSSAYVASPLLRRSVFEDA